MKNRQHHHNFHTATPALVPVRFEFTHPTATSVCLAGTFNDWQPSTEGMHSSGIGNWWNETSLPPGTYEYCLVVDGQWIADPLAKDHVPNPFGGTNSVLMVASSPEAAHLADAVALPLKNVNKPKTRKIEPNHQAKNGS
jgi:1,4-alpha-glucan branching enzyme